MNSIAKPAYHRAAQAMGFAAYAVISLYKAMLSPILVTLLGPACRYEPTCSTYARQALQQYGALQGGWMAIKRLARCHPLGDWGYDPVPKESNVFSARPRAGIADEHRRVMLQG